MKTYSSLLTIETSTFAGITRSKLQFDHPIQQQKYNYVTVKLFDFSKSVIIILNQIVHSSI